LLGLLALPFLSLRRGPGRFPAVAFAVPSDPNRVLTFPAGIPLGYDAAAPGDRNDQRGGVMSTESNRNGQPDDWRKDPELWAAYEKARSEVTEEEKRAFRIDEPQIPFDEIVKELEELQRRQKGARVQG
jgi:hypothetical protein